MNRAFQAYLAFILSAGLSASFFAAPVHSQSAQPEPGSFGLVGSQMGQIVRQSSRNGSVLVRFADDDRTTESRVTASTWTAFTNPNQAISALDRAIDLKLAHLTGVNSEVRNLEAHLRRGYDDAWLEAICDCLGSQSKTETYSHPERLTHLQKLSTDCAQFDESKIVSLINAVDFFHQCCEDLRLKIEKSQRGAERELRWERLQPPPANEGQAAERQREIRRYTQSLDSIDALTDRITTLSTTRQITEELYFEVYGVCTDSLAAFSRVAAKVKDGRNANSETESVLLLAEAGSGLALIQPSTRVAATKFESAHTELIKRRYLVVDALSADGQQQTTAPKITIDDLELDAFLTNDQRQTAARHATPVTPNPTPSTSPTNNKDAASQTTKPSYLIFIIIGALLLVIILWAIT